MKLDSPPGPAQSRSKGGNAIQKYLRGDRWGWGKGAPAFLPAKGDPDYENRRGGTNYPANKGLKREEDEDTLGL